MGVSEKNNFNRVAVVIVLSLVVGIGVATGAYFLIICEDCIKVQSTTQKQDSSTAKCENDPRCIIANVTGPDTTIASEIGYEKVKFLQELVSESIIQNALKSSNQKDSKMKEDIRNQIYNLREKEWITSEQPTPFMNSIIDNDVADFLRDNLVIRSDEVGDLVFGEHILTNLYGPNVAVSIRTDNYLQSNDDWWQQSKNEPEKEFARECEFDSSAQMFSEDLVIGIFDGKGELIGIMNSATPCDVTQAFLDADKTIRAVPYENLSEIGKHKISYLQELMREPTIQEALRLSNQEFSSITDEGLLKLKEETEWPNPLKEEPTDFQLSIINNEVADILRENLVVESEDFGELLFPEMILTNAKGVNVASTDRTFNYIQNEQEWWIVASQNDVLVRKCGFDKSIKMTSEDIIIQIFDDGEFIGILNSASTCDVILNKGALFFGDSN